MPFSCLLGKNDAPRAQETGTCSNDLAAENPMRKPTPQAWPYSINQPYPGNGTVTTVNPMGRPSNGMTAEIPMGGRNKLPWFHNVKQPFRQHDRHGRHPQQATKRRGDKHLLGLRRAYIDLGAQTKKILSWSLPFRSLIEERRLLGRCRAACRRCSAPRLRSQSAWRRHHAGREPTRHGQPEGKTTKRASSTTWKRVQKSPPTQ